MQAMSANDAKGWCTGQGAKLGPNGFPEPQGTTQAFTIPVNAGQRVALAAEHLRGFRGERLTLVWFNDWAVWPSGQRMHIFERILASYGEQRPLIEAPAFLFSQEEHEDLVSFVTLGLLFLWDVHVVGANADRLLFYSHDEIGWVGA